MRAQLVLAAMAASVTATPVFARAIKPAERCRDRGRKWPERQSSQLALGSTTDPNIRSFATMKVSARQQHRRRHGGCDEIERGCSAAMLMPTRAEMIAQLKAERGAARDGAYIAQQKGA